METTTSYETKDLHNAIVAAGITARFIMKGPDKDLDFTYDGQSSFISTHWEIDGMGVKLQRVQKWPGSQVIDMHKNPRGCTFDYEIGIISERDLVLISNLNPNGGLFHHYSGNLRDQKDMYELQMKLMKYSRHANPHTESMN